MEENQYTQRGTVEMDRSTGVLSIKASFDGNRNWLLNKFTNNDHDSRNDCKSTSNMFLLSLFLSFDCDIEFVVKSGTRTILKKMDMNHWQCVKNEHHDETKPFLLEYYTQDYQGANRLDVSPDGMVTITTFKSTSSEESQDGTIRTFNFKTADLVSMKATKRLVDDMTSRFVFEAEVKSTGLGYDRAHTLDVMTWNKSYFESIYRLSGWDFRDEHITEPYKTMKQLFLARQEPEHILSDIYVVKSEVDICRIIAEKGKFIEHSSRSALPTFHDGEQYYMSVKGRWDQPTVSVEFKKINP